MNNNLLTELFDYENFAHKDFLGRYKYPWEVVKNLDKYLSEQADEQIIGEGTVIDPSAKIEGKIIIGKNCTIADNVLIRGNCLIGDDVHIGHAVEIKHSIIMDHTAVAHLNYIGDSIVGNNVNVGGGAIFANWRFDKKNIKVKLDEEFDTGLEKYGACVGDDSKLGVNCVLNPGTILGKDSLVFPLVSVFGVHSEESVIKR